MFRYRKIVLVFGVLMALAVPAMAQATDTISIDTGSFIAGINTWLPMAVSIIVIGVGIAGAFALAEFVGNMIIGAFRGKIGRK